MDLEPKAKHIIAEHKEETLFNEQDMECGSGTGYKKVCAMSLLCGMKLTLHCLFQFLINSYNHCHAKQLQKFKALQLSLIDIALM